MYALYLNDMRAPKIEHSNTYVCADADRQALVDLVNREKVETYTDEVYGKKFSKNFRPGGPLEWFNPPWDIYRDEVDSTRGGIHRLRGIKDLPGLAT